MAKFLKQYQIFYKKAKTDYKAAYNLFEDFKAGDVDLDLDVVFFHLQQCAEKSLKAVLAFREIDFTKTHDLEILFNIAKKHGFQFLPRMERLIDLSDYAVEGRYGVIQDDIEDVQVFFQLINELLEQIENYIQS